MRRPLWIILALLVFGFWLWSQQRAPALSPPASSPVPTASSRTAQPDPAPPTRAELPGADVQYPAFLPVQAHDVLARIARGGPFEYRQDGGVFQNREGRLPRQPRGYYREYTVETPGSRDRGARRIITGGGVPGESPPREYWYTSDHYRNFQRFSLESAGASR